MPNKPKQPTISERAQGCLLITAMLTGGLIIVGKAIQKGQKQTEQAISHLLNNPLQKALSGYLTDREIVEALRGHQAMTEIGTFLGKQAQSDQQRELSIMIGEAEDLLSWINLATQANQENPNIDVVNFYISWHEDIEYFHKIFEHLDKQGFITEYNRDGTAHCTLVINGVTITLSQKPAEGNNEKKDKPNVILLNLQFMGFKVYPILRGIIGKMSPGDVIKIILPADELYRLNHLDGKFHYETIGTLKDDFNKNPGPGTLIVELRKE